MKNFKDYVDLYLRGVKNSDGEQPKTVHEICNPRWEICVTVSDNGFQQASFVNSIATTKVCLISYVYLLIQKFTAVFIRSMIAIPRDKRIYLIRCESLYECLFTKFHLLSVEKLILDCCSRV